MTRLSQGTLDSTSPRHLVLIERLTLWGGLCASLLLTFQASAPLREGFILPHGVNWLLFLVLGAALALFLPKARSEERLGVGVCLLSWGHLLILGDFIHLPTPPVVASDLAAGLSRTWLHLPIYGLLHSWVMVCFGWLSARITVQAIAVTRGPSPPLARWEFFLAGSVGLLVAGFGVFALLGYATGQISLLLG